MRKKAIYLRKSRDETKGREDVLAKHRATLVEMCEKNGWDYVIYEEIGESDSLASRPEIQRLLDDVEEGLYDGILVMDYDRFSRGDEMDAAFIKRIFKRAGITVITPRRIYDLSDEDSETLMGLEAVLARREYKTILRRLKRGKESGAKMGKWVQGPAPFPYTFNTEKKLLVVEEDKRPHYLLMKQLALEGVSPMDISYRLNAMGVRGNRGKPWVAETVQRLLLNPVHMGKIIYGKTTRGPDGKAIKLPPDEWKTGEGNHERLKTPEEHARILSIIYARRRIGNKAHEGKTPLSGLVKCARCGYTVRSVFHRGRYVLFACNTRSPIGEKCGNGGVRAEVVYAAIDRAVADHLDRLRRGVASKKPSNDVTALLEAKRQELIKRQDALSRLVDLVADGLIDKPTFATKKEPIDRDVARIKEELAALEEAVASPAFDDAEWQKRLSVVTPDFWRNAEWTDKERHTFLSTLINYITMYCDNLKGELRFDVKFRQ